MTVAAPVVRDAAPSRLSALGSWFCLDSLIGAFAAWTIGFWTALALGLGWAFALGFSIVVLTALVLVARRQPTKRSRPSASSADTVPLAVILSIVLLWPVALEVGRPALAGLAVACLCGRLIHPILRGRPATPEIRLVIMASIALAATLAYKTSWTAMVVLLCLLAGAVVVRPQLTEWRPTPGGTKGGPRTPGGGRTWASRLDAHGLPTAMLGLFGLLIGVWYVGISFWSGDNAYYLNKAVHVSASARSFDVQDYMFGVEGATHYPLGNILSSFEPLLGMISAVSGVSVPRLLFQVTVPVSMFLIPFAIRYAARGVGLRRPDLVAGFAAAAILLMTGTSTQNLFAQASYGKTIGQLVAIPLVIGAAGYLLKRKDVDSAVRTALASICAVGLSPSLAGAVLLVLAPFTAVGLWELWAARPAGRRPTLSAVAWLLLPVGLLTAFAAYAQLLQQSAGSEQTNVGFRVFDSPEMAWREAFVGGDQTARFLTLLFLVGGTALFPLLLDDRRLRRAAGGMTLLIFGLVFAPWSFDPIIEDLLGINYFAWRFWWAVPAGVVVGGALAALDSRRTLGLLTVVAVTIGLGLSGPDLGLTAFLRPSSVDVRDAPGVWPWQAGIPAGLVRSARAIADATPDGGRFLATPEVEEVTTAIQIDDLPVYVRRIYVIPVGTVAPAPPGFDLKDRLLLAEGMMAEDPNVYVNKDFIERVTSDRWRQALERVDVATVCMDLRIVASLREVVVASYSSLGWVGACELWVRSPA